MITGPQKRKHAGTIRNQSKWELDKDNDLISIQSRQIRYFKTDAVLAYCLEKNKFISNGTLRLYINTDC